METTNEHDRLAYRTAARVWLDISETVTQKLPVECSFVGAYCYAAGVPVTIYAISKQFFSGSWATAKRYCDMMCDVGALEYTDSGMVVVTEKGNQTSDWYFQRLFEMAEQVSQVEPKVSAKVVHLKEQDDK